MAESISYNIESNGKYKKYINERNEQKEGRAIFLKYLEL